MNRRGFLLGLGATLAAPAVVKAASLMLIQGIIEPVHQFTIRTSIPAPTWRLLNQGIVYGSKEIAPVRFTGFNPLQDWDRLLLEGCPDAGLQGLLNGEWAEDD